MAQRGRKKGCTDIEAHTLRQRLFAAYDQLCTDEKDADAVRAGFLPRGYYVEKLFEMRIAAWSKSRISKLLMYRYKQNE